MIITKALIRIFMPISIVFALMGPLCSSTTEVLVEELSVPATASLQNEFAIGQTCNQPGSAGPSVKSVALISGGNYHITASGTATTLGTATTDPNGEIQSGTFCNYSEGQTMPADDYECACTTGIPVQNGATAGSLIGLFLNANSQPVGSPFVVGSDVQTTLPDEAVLIAFAINDDDFNDNAGSFAVKIFEIQE